MESISSNEGRGVMRRKLSFGIGNLLLVIALVAVCLAWWQDHHREQPRVHDVPGPLSVSYSIRTSPSSTSGSDYGGVQGIDFRGDNVIVHTKSGGLILPSSRLVHFRWATE